MERTITWKITSAYDLFVSLDAIHKPGKYGLRPAWAAGVRSRLPTQEREVLQFLHAKAIIPLHWIIAQPTPIENAADVLAFLRRLPPEKRLVELMAVPFFPDHVQARLRQIAAAGRWSEADYKSLQKEAQKQAKKISRKQLTEILDTWAEAPQHGETYLTALEIYYAEFFEAEEQRILPILRASMARAQELAQTLSLGDLLEKLSQGIQYEIPEKIHKLVISPCFWSTPLIIEMPLGDTLHFVYGAKPPTVSLVPGEVVPDDLTQALKALSDPTRLRILRYLSEEPLTPSELAQALRLRPPTVTHHLQTLRLARLVRFTLHQGERRHYTIRAEGVEAVCNLLRAFLNKEDVATSAEPDVTGFISPYPFPTLFASIQEESHE